MKFALVLDNEVKEVREYEELPECKRVDGKPVLRPLVKASTEDGYVVDGYTVYDDRVEENVREETELEKEAREEDVKKVVKGNAKKTLCGSLAKIVLGLELDQKDIDAATDYLS